MRHFAFAGLLILAGCMDDYSPAPTSRPRSLPDAAAICPSGDCWGLHTFEPPTKCVTCGQGGLPYYHFYCTECAAKLERCAHCGRKSPAKPEVKKETPPPSEPAPPPPPPVEKKEPPPPPEPKAMKPEAGEKLAVEPVDLSGTERQNHSVLVFAAHADRARLALEAHRSRKEKVISELPETKAGFGAGLYLIWGHFPKETLKESDVRATFDAKSGLVRVTLPPWSGYLPGGGIGMDWGVDRGRTWTFVGFRVKIESLPAGSYSFELVEVDDFKSPRALSSGTFELKKN